CHQVNLEYIAGAVLEKEAPEGLPIVYPDTLVGTDSHTTMINGLGVLGWGVGGIEAEAAMLGQPIYMLMPEVVGFRLKGQLKEGVTATDLTLTVTQMLRAHGVVGKFVEFFGQGLSAMSLPDRATIANMAPEYGATMGFFPIDQETLDFLTRTARPPELVEKVGRYMKLQGLFRTDDMPDPEFASVLELDLGDVQPSMAGPKRPQDRIVLADVQREFKESLLRPASPQGFGLKEEALANTGRYADDQGRQLTMRHGDVAIAAITSCTNTSNPSVMLGAGLLARKARALGLTSKPWVKTSLAPGSQVVTEYLEAAGLMEDLRALRFNLVGYGCTTCIGNSGPLDPAITKAIVENQLVVASALSGNRNFEGRVSPLTRANYLASPPLVVAYALAGTIDIDFASEPIGQSSDGKDVFLKDIWPSNQEITETLRASVSTKQFEERYGAVFEGTEEWRQVEVPTGKTYAWEESSTYIRNPPFFDGVQAGGPPALADIEGARVLALLGDNVTTDHISPAGAIAKDSPAAQYLRDQGVSPRDFNSYGSRRGNHEVMMRGTFANIRLRNLLAPGTEGGITRHLPSDEQTSIFDAAMRYAEEKTPLVVIAGVQYGTGSSRDWAAKGTFLLGVRAVITKGYERIHRSNLIGMGVLPLEFASGEGADELGLSGEEVFSIGGIAEGLEPGKRLTVKTDSGRSFEVLVRLDTPQEVEYYRHGGILQYVLRQMAS
ncbi:MAG: aconitate hydratase AcnA, partial [Myxococcota bacterium]